MPADAAVWFIASSTLCAYPLASMEKIRRLSCSASSGYLLRHMPSAISNCPTYKVPDQPMGRSSSKSDHRQELLDVTSQVPHQSWGRSGKIDSARNRNKSLVSLLDRSQHCQFIWRIQCVGNILV